MAGVGRIIGDGQCGETGPARHALQAASSFGNPHRRLLFVRGTVLLLAVLFAAAALAGADQEMRFPAPEFKSGYKFPDTTVPSATSETQQWIDVAVLAAALTLAAWLAVKRHSRRGLFWLMIFSLLYFGFYKQGCICPIGSIQNVTLSLFNSHYALPITVLLFFALPLLFALFFGRVFCSSICALGAMQDLVAIKPIQLSRKVTIGLSVIPYAYLGLAVLLAATDTGFLICRYDPFIGFFRLTGNAPYLYLRKIVPVRLHPQTQLRTGPRKPANWRAAAGLPRSHAAGTDRSLRLDWTSALRAALALQLDSGRGGANPGREAESCAGADARNENVSLEGND
jgi:hypothetical protein